MADSVVLGAFGAAGVPSLEETAAKGLSCYRQGEAGGAGKEEKYIIIEEERSPGRLGRRYHHGKGLPDSFTQKEVSSRKRRRQESKGDRIAEVVTK